MSQKRFLTLVPTQNRPVERAIFVDRWGAPALPKCPALALAMTLKLQAGSLRLQIEQLIESNGLEVQYHVLHREEDREPLVGFLAVVSQTLPGVAKNSGGEWNNKWSEPRCQRVLAWLKAGHNHDMGGVPGAPGEPTDEYEKVKKDQYHNAMSALKELESALETLAVERQRKVFEAAEAAKDRVARGISHRDLYEVLERSSSSLREWARAAGLTGETGEQRIYTPQEVEQIRTTRAHNIGKTKFEKEADKWNRAIEFARRAQ